MALDRKRLHRLFLLTHISLFLPLILFFTHANQPAESIGNLTCTWKNSSITDKMIAASAPDATFAKVIEWDLACAIVSTVLLSIADSYPNNMWVSSYNLILVVCRSAIYTFLNVRNLLTYDAGTKNLIVWHHFYHICSDVPAWLKQDLFQNAMEYVMLIVNSVLLLWILKFSVYYFTYYWKVCKARMLNEQYYAAVQIEDDLEIAETSLITPNVNEQADN